MNNKNSFDKRLGKNIQRIRKEQGLTQEEVAQRLGTMKQTVSKIERGVYSSSAKVLNDICQAINASPNELFYADTEHMEWKEENIRKTSYSINGLADYINIMEDLWAKADFYQEKNDMQKELAYLDQIIQACMKTGGENRYYRKFAEYLYHEMLNDYMDKSISEVRKNKINNIHATESEQK